MAILLVGAFCTLFTLGFPVALSIVLPSIGYILYEELTIELIAQRMLYAMDSFPLIAVPVFIFAGNLMNSSGITDRIFHFADTLVGRIPGGLAQVNIFGSLIFAGISGAALADVGGLGKVEIQAMRKRGFEDSFSGAVTAASAIVGPIFPPSIPLIIYGTVTSVSTVKLLIAGIGPALVCVAMMMIMTAFISLKRGYPRAARWPTWRELLAAFLPAIPALLAPVFLVGGMLSGLFTPTEAAAVVVVYIIVISSIGYRELTWRHVLQCALDTLRSSAGILVIVAAASIFGWILSVEQVPQAVAKFMVSISDNKYVLLLIVTIGLLIAGMFLDSTTATLLIVPIIAGPLVAVGVDPVHLGLITIFTLMIGLVTPPMGLSLFLICDIANVTIRKLIREMVPFYVPLVFTLVLITLVPEITTWLPSLMDR
ncbi:MAG: TRAP transporter large permease [Rhodospirillales bacterium]|nr:TRAP transporter large permease [Rhodospirillales bacterium]